MAISYLVKTFHGLEEVLAQEIIDLGGDAIEIQNRAVSCQGDLKLGYRLNYLSRTALAVLRPIVHGKVNSEADIYALVQSVKWYELFSIKNTILVRAVCYSELFRNSHFLELKAKDAIVDQFREKYHRRPSVSKDPDIKIDLFVKQDDCVVSIDISGASLFKRGYRLKTGEAPLNEVLAAGMVRLSQWNKEELLLDPMCGAGTIPIEAYLLASGQSPHFLRSEFGFQNLYDFDRRLWQSIVDKNAEVVNSAESIMGSDVDANVLRMARSNARNAGISKIKWKSKDFFQWHKPSDQGVLIFNPPYDERLSLENASEFYRKIGDHLKNNWKGWQAFILSSHLQAIKHIGLKTTKKIELFNGPLECRLLSYSLY